MPFGVVSGVGLGMGVLDFGGDRRRKGSFGGEFMAYHCNQWGLCWQYSHTDNISLESMCHWLSADIIRFKIEVGIEEKCSKKCSGHSTLFR